MVYVIPQKAETIAIQESCIINAFINKNVYIKIRLNSSNFDFVIFIQSILSYFDLVKYDFISLILSSNLWYFIIIYEN